MAISERLSPVRQAGSSYRGAIELVWGCRCNTCGRAPEAEPRVVGQTVALRARAGAEPSTKLEEAIGANESKWVIPIRFKRRPARGRGESW